MTWPNWSVARNRYRHVPPILMYVSSTCQRSPDRVLPSSCGLGELQRESLDPPVHRDVVDLDPAFGEKLFHVPVGEAETQVPPDRQGDDLGREPVAGEGRTGGWGGARVSVRSHRPSLPEASRRDQCNSAAQPDQSQGRPITTAGSRPIVSRRPARPGSPEAPRPGARTLREGPASVQGGLIEDFHAGTTAKGRIAG
jgi:hypothetical protein